mmetsp:Transcript_68773/g.224006  ORF Transcript_68773/g.224006 Transcript_68773/m.224006 type:complete len:313 (+) Transcript_68773:186-1124(+)
MTACCSTSMLGAAKEMNQPDDKLPDYDALEKDRQLLDWWRRSSGLQTVDDWASDYKKHPGGWGALLMIHGIPEVTGRLRSKVENFAIYSALFLSVSIGLIAGAADAFQGACAKLADDGIDWECEVQRRLYFYSFWLGTVSHMLSILLAMSFLNVLNEAARDSDVIRMFARGQGFVATVKCQRAFVVGCIADFLAIVVASKVVLGWEIVTLVALLTLSAAAILRQTTGLLSRSASISDYWRAELGGKADADDAYELEIPVACLRRRAEKARERLVQESPSSGSEGSGSEGIFSERGSEGTPLGCRCAPVGLLL